jgi:hypothetical protein
LAVDDLRQAIKLIDAEGRSYIITQNGKIVDSYGFLFDPEECMTGRIGADQV